MKLIAEFVLRQDKLFHSLFGKIIRRIFLSAFPLNIRLFGLLSSGAQFRFRPEDVTSVLSLSEAYGSFIPSALQRLRQDDIFVDIGANAGFWTIMAKSLQPDLKAVFSFEPQPELFSELCSNIERNELRNVFAFPVAVGTRCGSFGMKTFDGHSGKAHLVENGEGYLVVNGELLSPMILSFIENSTTLFVKVDVEGGEYDVIKSLRNLLERISRAIIIVEINNDHLGRFDASSSQIYKFMSGLGFKATLGENASKHYDEMFIKSSELSLAVQSR